MTVTNCTSLLLVSACLTRPIIVTMRVDKGDMLESLSQTCGLPMDKMISANGGALQAYSAVTCRAPSTTCFEVCLLLL